jgi:hypothetical protein
MPGKRLYKRELVKPLIIPKELINIVNCIVMRILITYASLESPCVVESGKLFRRAPELTEQVIDIWPPPDPLRKVVVTELLPKHRNPAISSHVGPYTSAIC